MQNIQILFVGDIGVTPTALKDAISKRLGTNSKLQLRKAISISDAFGELVNHRGGIFLVRLDDKANLANFINSFQRSVQKLNFADTKIVIFSTRDEILKSRVLGQFPFLSTINPNIEGKGLTDTIINACSSVLLKSEDSKTQSEGSSKFWVKGSVGNLGSVKRVDGNSPAFGKVSVTVQKDRAIRSNQNQGEIQTQAQTKAQDQILEVRESERRALLSTCLGPKVRTYVYDSQLDWRVKGDFIKIDKEYTAITFRSSKPDGTEKIMESIKEVGPLFFSSSSTKEARVFCALEFFGNEGTDFKFKIPYQMGEVQRRANLRLKLAKDAPVSIQFFNNKTKAVQTLPVLDMSQVGLGLRVDKEFEDQFVVGEILTDVILTLDTTTIKIPSAEIRHYSRSEAIDSNYKILGLTNLGLSKKDSEFIDMFVTIEGNESTDE